MTVRGRIKKGKVVLENPKALPEGTEVVVRAVKKPRKPGKPPKPSRRKKHEPTLTLAQRLAPFCGKARGLPPDASVNVDHYLYGRPKQK